MANVDRQAGADIKIEVTPEMVAAATNVLQSSGWLDYISLCDDELVFEMLTAALEMLPYSKRCPSR